MAVAAAINVTEPGSTGIGGDMFCLFYDAKTKKVHAMNGSGRSGKEVTLDKIRNALNIKEGEVGQIPMDSVHAVTVPGAAAGWVDCVERFGSKKVTLEDVLAPAIEIADTGFPVSELSAQFVRLATIASCDDILIVMAVGKQRRDNQAGVTQLCRDIQKGPLRKRWVPATKSRRINAEPHHSQYLQAPRQARKEGLLRG